VLNGRLRAPFLLVKSLARGCLLGNDIAVAATEWISFD